MAGRTIHATGVVLAGRGVLLRGPSGAGKSLLALSLLEHAARTGETALLVADDLVDIGPGPVMAGTGRQHGRIELRGFGMLDWPVAAVAPVDCIVDFVPDLVRLPEPEQFLTDLDGVDIARCPVPQAVSVEHQRLLVRAALGLLRA